MINWKVRFKNRLLLTQLFLPFAMPILAYLGLSFDDLTTWGSVGIILVKAISNPFVVGTVIVSVINAISDPTTKGFNDSVRARNIRNHINKIY